MNVRRALLLGYSAAKDFMCVFVMCFMRCAALFQSAMPSCIGFLRETFILLCMAAPFDDMFGLCLNLCDALIKVDQVFAIFANHVRMLASHRSHRRRICASLVSSVLRPTFDAIICVFAAVAKKYIKQVLYVGS